MAFIDVLTVASTGLAATATLFSAIVAARSAQQTSRAAETVRSVELGAAIDALDRPALRRVLYTELGSVRVSDYVSSEPLRKRFDELIAEVAHFVAEPEAAVASPVQVEPVSLRPEERVPAALTRAYQDLVSGDAWAALARLRRALEQRLTSILGDDPTGVREPRGAGQQLRRMRSLGRIDEGWYRQLGYVISVCNAAVHGEDVPTSQAAEVLDIVARWIETTSN